MASTFRPVNLKEALEFLHSQHALVLAGGTDFMLKRSRMTPDDADPTDFFPWNPWNLLNP